ncbi:MAG: hypothetical protein E6Q40_08620 [Cupriavidus sp.]|nr:MAG: hypothetical protein E6Q40_08620 [Cupriavidus sp.]
MQDLTWDEVDEVSGGGDRLDAFLIGAGVGGVVGAVGGVPGSAAGALIGGVLALMIYELP